MIERKVRMDRYTCDQPGCLETRVVEADDITEAFGLHGSVVAIDAGGGSANVDWFACSFDHVEQAIVNALKERGRG